MFHTFGNMFYFNLCLQSDIAYTKTEQKLVVRSRVILLGTVLEYLLAEEEFRVRQARPLKIK